MFDAKPNHHTHPYTATIGMWLFLASLTMLFGATMLGYLFIRLRGPASPVLHTIHFPPLLWVSTVAILAGSYTIQRALQAVRLERQALMQRYLLLTCVLAVVFVAIQVPSLAALLSQHRSSSPQGLRLYGLVFVLILLHALHVLGGIIGLIVTTVHARQGRYDHENFAGVKHAAMYWHFLDGVWLVMYLGMFFAG
jgi:heme/copper-type cytochrome/quinol oxidase subunit 3